MEVDIYRRPEPQDKFSFLIVPKGQPIPEEATNTDWALREQGVHVDDAAQLVHPYEIERPRDQIQEKGYAITSIRNQVPADKAGA